MLSLPPPAGDCERIPDSRGRRTRFKRPPPRAAVRNSRLLTPVRGPTPRRGRSPAQGMAISWSAENAVISPCSIDVANVRLVLLLFSCGYRASPLFERLARARVVADRPVDDAVRIKDFVHGLSWASRLPAVRGGTDGPAGQHLRQGPGRPAVPREVRPVRPGGPIDPYLFGNIRANEVCGPLRTTPARDQSFDRKGETRFPGQVDSETDPSHMRRSGGQPLLARPASHVAPAPDGEKLGAALRISSSSTAWSVRPRRRLAE